MWPDNTRLKVIQLSTQSGAVGTLAIPCSWDFPKTGILAGLHLSISSTLVGSITSPNALGTAAIIRRVRLYANSGISIIDMSGAGYHYLYRDFIDSYVDPVSYDTSRSVIAAGTFTLDMYFPIAINSRDPLGLIMLQNEQTQLNLQVEFESNANIGTSVTSDTVTITPMLEIFAVPVDPKDWPSFQYLHTLTEESLSVAGAGDVVWYWPRGNVYQRVLHGVGINQSPADTWSRAKMRVNGGDVISDYTVQYLNAQFARYRGRSRLLGVVPFDLMGTSGLGNYGSARDLFDSSLVTDVASVITTTGAVTFYTVKDQLVNLAPGGTPQR